MSRHKVQKSSAGNYSVSKKSNPLTQTRPWTNSYQQRNDQAEQQPASTVKPPTTEEWMKNNVLLKAIETTRQAQLQMKCDACETQESRSTDSDNLQLKECGTKTSPSIQQIAATGFDSSATQLPHLNQIQQSFGVDLSHIRAYIGGKAADANQQIGSKAYASGNQIAFKEQPSLELAAHEAAHVVQQQSGRVQLAGGVGKVGDQYELHADAVAQRVSAGRSARDLLTEYNDKSSSSKGLQASFSSSSGGSSSSSGDGGQKTQQNSNSTHHSPWPWIKDGVPQQDGTISYPGRVELRYTPVQLGANHGFVVVTSPFKTDASGKLMGDFYETHYRGGPSNSNPLDWGFIQTRSAPYTEGERDWTLNPKGRLEVITSLTTEQCTAYRTKFQATMEAILSARIAYGLPSPFGGCGGKANSNSTAHQAIRDAGLGDPTPPVLAPCWNVNPFNAKKYEN